MVIVCTSLVHEHARNINKRKHAVCVRDYLTEKVFDQSCAPTNWWSAAALGSLMTGGGGVGGVRPVERAPKQRTRCTGVFSGFTGVSHFTCDLRWDAIYSAEKLTVNMHAVHIFFTVLVS